MFNNLATLDPQELWRRRQTTDAMMAGGISAQYQNPGLGRIAEALIGRANDRRLQPHEDRARADAAAALSGAFGWGGQPQGFGQQAAPQLAPMHAPPAAPVGAQGIGLGFLGLGLGGRGGNPYAPGGAGWDPQERLDRMTGPGQLARMFGMGRR